jgi:hypothetical protein
MTQYFLGEIPEVEINELKVSEIIPSSGTTFKGPNQ